MVNSKIIDEEIVNNHHSKLLKDFISDFEIGMNVSNKSKKGGRSKKRLDVLKRKVRQFISFAEQRGIKDITKISEDELHKLSHDLYNGKIKRLDGKPYDCPADFIRNFKAFWHWWMKMNRKKNIQVLDKCEDLPLDYKETKFVYFTKDQHELMLPDLDYDWRILWKFCFDSMMRFPSEISKLKVKDIYEKNGEVWVNVSDEVASKTGIGRNLNLLYCGEDLLRYIKTNELEEDDFLFGFLRNSNKVKKFNQKLKEVAVNKFGDKVSHPAAKEPFSKISGYDARHCGAIHLRILCQKNGSLSLDSIRQRGGWKDFKMLNYYTKFIGLTGEIKKESLLVEDDKSRLEKELIVEKEKRIELEKKFKNMEENIKEQLMQQFKKEVKGYLDQEILNKTKAKRR